MKLDWNIPNSTRIVLSRSNLQALLEALDAGLVGPEISRRIPRRDGEVFTLIVAGQPDGEHYGPGHYSPQADAYGEQKL